MATVPDPQSGNPAATRPPLRSVSAAAQAFELDDGDSSSLSVEVALRVVRRYRWSILAMALLGGIIGGLNALSAVPVYRAEARLLVKLIQPGPGNVNQFDQAPLHWLFYQTQTDIITSRAIAERVVAKLDAEQPAAVEPTTIADGVEASGLLQSVRDTWREITTEWLPDWRSWLPAAGGARPTAPQLPEAARKAAAIQAGLVVSGGKESEVLVVSYDATDPVRAARVANAVAEAYIEFGLESRVSNVQQATRWLGERIEVLRRKLTDSEVALREFQAREGMVGTQNREQIISSKMASLTAELVRAQTRRSEAQLRYQQVERLSGKGADTDYESLASLVDSERTSDAYKDRKAQRRRVTELGERYGARHPKMIAALAELKATERRLESELRKAVTTLRKDYEIAQAQERHFKSAIDEQQREMRSLSGKAFELDKLEKEVEANRRIYESFLERFKQADVAGEYDGTNVRVIDPAQPPASPFKPNKQRIVTVAVAAGLLLGLVIAFLRLQMDRTFKVKEDAENVLRLPVLGMVPKLRRLPWKRSGAESSVRDVPRSAFAESISDIRTALLFSRVDERLRTILITSAVPGEGKTTLASNLALSFGHRGRTLLLEGDLRKGRLDSLLEGDQLPGLTDVISGQCSLGDAVVRYPGTEKVYVLPGGTQAPNPLELLSSKRFAACFERLKEEFDYVLVDGSPLLPVSDSVVLADKCDITVLAIQSERTTHALAREAVKRLAGAHIRPAGVILQQVDFRRLRQVHGDHSGYGRYYVYRGYYGKPG